MIRRRSFVQMLGFAPAAAAIGVTPPAPEVPKTASVRAMAFGASAGPTVWGDAGSPVVDRVREARNRLRFAKWQHEQGIFNSRNRYTDHNLESRRATSPAIKALLQEEYQVRRRLVEVEQDLQWELAKRVAPDWVRKLVGDL